MVSSLLPAFGSLTLGRKGGRCPALACGEKGPESGGGRVAGGSLKGRSASESSAVSCRPQCPASRIQPPPPRPPTEGRTCEAAAAPCTTPSGPRRPRPRSRPTAGKWGSPPTPGGPPAPAPLACDLAHAGLDRPPGTARHAARALAVQHLAKSLEK